MKKLFQKILCPVDPNDQMATLLLGRCLKKQGPRTDPADVRLQNLERLKTDFEEKAYLQLKSLIDPKNSGATAQ